METIEEGLVRIASGMPRPAAGVADALCGAARRRMRVRESWRLIELYLRLHSCGSEYSERGV